MTQVVTSSITGIQALLWEKLSEYNQIVIKYLKKEKKLISNKFYMNFHLTDDLRTEFIV